jgi:hypothetical protein
MIASRRDSGATARALLLSAMPLCFTVAACAEQAAAPARLELPRRASEPADLECLSDLRLQNVPFLAAAPTRGIRTPVEITGALDGVRLTPRAGRRALMDCELARALAEAAPIVRAEGFTELFFSGAYDYRTRRRSPQMSAHAFGLAIDVHALSGPAGVLEVKRDFEAGSGRWRGLPLREGDFDGCVGHPRRLPARHLRQLVCRLKHHSAFRVVLTPDDDSDHRDHLHLEAFPDADLRVLRVLGRH